LNKIFCQKYEKQTSEVLQKQIQFVAYTTQ